MQKNIFYFTSATVFSLFSSSQQVLAENLETVVVTAVRTEQNVSQLPLSATVLGEQTLQVQNPDHPAEVLNLVPGVNLHRGSGAEHLTAVRSPVLTGGAGAGSFLYLQNGVPLRSAGFANTNGLLDAQYEFAQQIEVVRGPSGPAHGANAVHGLFNVVTPLPSALQHNTLQLSGDSQQRYKGRGLMAAHGEQHAWLLGLAANNESGYREDAGLAQQKAILSHQYLGFDNTDIDTSFSFNNLNQETAGFIFGEEALSNRELRRENAFPFAYRDAQSAHWQSQISRDLNTLSQFKITPFARWHRMNFLQHFLPSQAVEKNGHWSIGLQSDWQRSFAKGQVSAGIDLEYTQGFLNEFQTLPTVFSYTQGLHYDYAVKSRIAAGFVQGDYAIYENLQLVGGVRVDSTHYRYDNRTQTGTVGRFFRPADRTDAFTTASPKIALRYQASEQWSSYLSWSRANRPPQTSDLYRLQVNQTTDSARAERMDALEWGLRYTASRLSASVALYDMEKKNFFFRDADGFNVNNGRTRHQGAEFDIRLKLLKNVQLVSAFSLAEHTYRFNRSVDRESEIIRAGSEVDSAPNVLANTRLIWQAKANALLEVQWQKVGDYYTDAANSQQYAGHDVFNLRMVYDFSADTQLTLSLRNATGELYAERADFAFGNQRYFPGETETLGLSLRKRF